MWANRENLLRSAIQNNNNNHHGSRVLVFCHIPSSRLGIVKGKGTSTNILVSGIAYGVSNCRDFVQKHDAALLKRGDDRRGWQNVCGGGLLAAVLRVELLEAILQPRRDRIANRLGHLLSNVVVGRGAHLDELAGGLAEDFMSLAGEVVIVPVALSAGHIILVFFAIFHSPEEVVARLLANLLLHTEFLDGILVLRLGVDQSAARGGDVAELGGPLADARGVGELLGDDLALHELVGLKQEDVAAHPAPGVALESLVPVAGQLQGDAVTGGVNVGTSLNLETGQVGDVDDLGEDNEDRGLHPLVDDVQLAEKVVNALVDGEKSPGALDLGVVKDVVDAEPDGEQGPLLGRLDGPHALEALHLDEIANLLLEIAKGEVGEVVRRGGVLEDGIVKHGANRVSVVLSDLRRQRAGVIVYRVAKNLLVGSESAGSLAIRRPGTTYLLTERLGPDGTAGGMSDGLIAGRRPVENIAACVGPGVAKGDDPAHRAGPRLLELGVLTRRGNDPAQVEDEGDGKGDDDGTAREEPHGRRLVVQ